MRLIKTLFASVIAVSALAAPIAASAHPHCWWEVHHHHKVHVCR